MAEAVLSITLGTLHDLLLEEARFLSGVEDQVEEIQDQLRTMKSFLKDADQRQLKEERVRTWVQQVRSLAYKTEDVLETYAVEVASKKGKGKGIKNILKRFACILSEGKAVHKVGEEIANIKSKINNLKSSRDAFDINDINQAESSREAKQKQRLLRETYGHKDEQNFVGRKDAIQGLVSLITDDENHHRLICIYGMGGLGKTTLATKLFNHGVVRNSFDAFAWVCITQEMQIDKVVQDILRQLGNAMDGDHTILISELYKVLKEKKCLVVLDDIWKVEDWNILNKAFPDIEANSKVILTTRIEEVAQKGFPHKPEIFTEEEGWELLQKLAFPKHDKKDHEIESAFEPLGMELVRKCGYLPLAISVLGGILKGKKIIEWKRLNEDGNLFLKREMSNEKTLQNVLDLSYNELPYYLKACFLYLGRYREDETINAKDLYLLWIAEGLVLSEHQEEEETMMDVAKSYLKELASRCMVYVEIDELSLVPTVETCRLHDLLRDLCLDRGKKENFCKVIGFDPKQSIIDLSDEGRKLNLYLPPDLDPNMSTPEGGTQLQLFQKVKGQNLRTLYVNCVLYSTYHLLEDISYLKKFKLLRALALVGCEFELPSEISQLIHLRYLSLKRSKVKKLPSSISNLPYLQVLNLRTNSDVDMYLPNIFWKIKRLKFIYLPEKYHASETLQFNDLTELEILKWVQYLGDKTINLSGLVNLRNFSGEFEYSHSLSQVIDQIHNCCRKIKHIDIWIKKTIVGPSLTSEQGSALLRKILLCENLGYLTVGCHFGTFPPYEPQFCQKLTSLNLEDTQHEEDLMEFLEKLPNLRRLSLWSNAFIGKNMICNAMAFPQLKYLLLSGLPNLEEWRVDKDALLYLSKLEISRCPKLKTITDGLNFSALESFSVWDMPPEFEKKYQELYKQERHKLSELQHQNNSSFGVHQGSESKHLAL